MHTLALQYKCTFSLSLYICDDNNDYFSLSRHYVIYFIFYIYIYINIYIYIYIYTYIYVYMLYVKTIFFAYFMQTRNEQGEKKEESLPAEN